MPAPGAVGAGARSALALGLTAVYAVCFVAIKAGLPYAPPLWFGGLRALIGGLALLGLAIVVRRPALPARGSWPGVVGLALAATTFGFGAMFLSPGRTGAGIASVLGNTQPLIVAVLAALLLGERMTRGKGAALALGLVGVTLVSSSALLGPAADGLSGALLALAASAGFAVGSVLVKCMGPQPSVLSLTAWQLILGGLPLLAASAVVERDERVRWTGVFVALLLFLALAGTALANALWFWLVQRDDVGRLTTFLFLVPVFGVAVAALAFGERVGPVEAVGLAGIIAAVGVTARTPVEAPTPLPARAGSHAHAA